ncbi:MAG TPA: hypothetical protein VM733_12945 [Thermoanaerobaculia bacterium]|nr:hypothetical protein [Thermoanaerobaculia bacterium]
MKIVRGRADARWLPSRFNFALFRLLAFSMMRVAAPEHRDVSLIIDRNQNNLESHLVGLWTTLTVTCWLAGTLFASWPVPLALVVAFPLAINCLSFPVVAMLAARRGATNVGLNSVMIMTMLIIAALCFARAHTWIRFVAWQFLGGIALNAIAAPFAYLLRGSIAEMDNAAGGISSEL